MRSVSKSGNPKSYNKIKSWKRSLAKIKIKHRLRLPQNWKCRCFYFSFISFSFYFCNNDSRLAFLSTLSPSLLAKALSSWHVTSHSILKIFHILLLVTYINRCIILRWKKKVRYRNTKSSPRFKNKINLFWTLSILKKW